MKWSLALVTAIAARRGVHSLISNRVQSPADASPIVVHGHIIHEELAPLAERIERSRQILDISPDDDEDGVGYAEATWSRAVALVASLSNQYWDSKRRVPPIPAISDGPSGSIDIVWRQGTRQLMANVSPEPSEPTTLFGNDTTVDDSAIRWSIRPEEQADWLLVWLTT